MTEETQAQKLSPAMQHAWREACAQRFDSFADELFVRLHKYYTFADPDPVRPLVNKAMADALHQFFDPSAYPEGMTQEAVLQSATLRLAQHFETFFAPHRPAMLLHGKKNFHKGKPAASISWNGMDRTMMNYSEHLSELMLEAAQEVGLPKVEIILSHTDRLELERKLIGVSRSPT